uniref:Uncharacterized protein n=1 Tax=Peronospora matthiolae TaxID=2874970 RepID=A0AAV1UFJ8_9STRA
MRSVNLIALFVAISPFSVIGLLQVSGLSLMTSPSSTERESTEVLEINAREENRAILLPTDLREYFRKFLNGAWLKDLWAKIKGRTPVGVSGKELKGPKAQAKAVVSVTEAKMALKLETLEKNLKELLEVFEPKRVGAEMEELRKKLEKLEAAQLLTPLDKDHVAEKLKKVESEIAKLASRQDHTTPVDQGVITKKIEKLVKTVGALEKNGDTSAAELKELKGNLLKLKNTLEDLEIVDEARAKMADLKAKLQNVANVGDAFVKTGLHKMLSVKIPGGGTKDFALRFFRSSEFRAMRDHYSSKSAVALNKSILLNLVREKSPHEVTLMLSAARQYGGERVRGYAEALEEAQFENWVNDGLTKETIAADIIVENEAKLQPEEKKLLLGVVGRFGEFPKTKFLPVKQ